MTSRIITVAAAAVLFASAPFDGAQGVPSLGPGTAYAQTPAARECAGSDAPSKWSEADANNQRCAAAGLRMIQSNRAVPAAIEANAAAGEKFSADPFRAPHRWSGKRGSYQ